MVYTAQNDGRLRDVLSISYILIGIQFNIFLGYSKFHHRLFGSSKASPLGNTKI